MSRRSRAFDPMHPGWLPVFALLAGLVAAGPLAGAILARCGRRLAGVVVGGVLFLLGLALLGFFILWNAKWYWVSIVMGGTHICCGTVLFLVLQPMYERWRARNETPLVSSGAEQQAFRSLAVGVLAGLGFGVVFGPIFSAAFNLALGELFSTSYMVTFDNEFALTRLFLNSAGFVAAAVAVGGLLGRFRRHTTPAQLLVYILAFLWGRLTLSFALEAIIALPGFQAGALTEDSSSALYFPILSGELAVGFWWSSVLVFFITAPRSGWDRLSRAAQVVGINLAVGLVLSISLGFLPEAFLAMGMDQERNGSPRRALFCYEMGLKKNPNETVSAFLQYRVALLYNKLGQREKAETGLRRVVAKYTENKELVRKASSLLKNLFRAGDAKRVVLPGVEMRSEYKDAYCAPNSLALVLRYWGADVTAREIGRTITGLGTGTYLVDSDWYAQDKGFRHEHLPMASVQDVKDCIDAGFPVLVYVPGHVFAIFGYDDGLQTFVTFDVATRDVWSEYPQKDFIRAWKKRISAMTLLYPPDEERQLPERIRSRLQRLSSKYLDYHLRFFDTEWSVYSKDRLRRAAGEDGELFFAVTELSRKVPALRPDLDARYDAHAVIARAMDFFGEDFDEAACFAGQQGCSNTPRTERTLSYALSYFSAHEAFEEMIDLISRIDENGQISSSRLSLAGMIDFSMGRTAQGLDRIKRAQNTYSSFYKGLVYLQHGHEQVAVQDMISPLNRSTFNLQKHAQIFLSFFGDDQRYWYKDEKVDPFFDISNGLTYDTYSYPSTALANLLLSAMPDLGQSQEKLERLWYIWLAFSPQDAAVSTRLTEVYEQRLQSLDGQKHPGEYELLEERAELVRARAERYEEFGSHSLAEE